MKTQVKLENYSGNYMRQYFRSCNDEVSLDLFLEAYNPLERQNIYQGYVGLEKGWNLILKHTKGKVGILMDTDMDGLLSASLMWRFLYQYLGIEADCILHTAEDEKHGLTSEVVKGFETVNYDLLIIPDAGSNNENECMFLKIKGWVKDILILDHHPIQSYHKFATMINCHHRANLEVMVNTHTSGTGVVWMFVKYIADQLQQDLFKDSLSYVAFSLISDVCDLSVWDNRAFIKYGLELSNLDRTLSYLSDVLLKGSLPNPERITWEIVPKINALFRYNQAKDIRELFLLLAHHPAITLLGWTEPQQEIVKTLTQLHSKQQREVTTITEQLETQLDASRKVLIIDAGKYSSRFYGLIASKLEGKYHKPVLVLHYYNDLWCGSVRTSNPDFFQYCVNSGLFEYVEGHPEGAFGVGFVGENSQDIVNYFESLNLTKEIVYPVTYQMFRPETIPDELFEITNCYKDLWGKGIEKPTVAILSIDINGKDIQVIGKNKTTIKFYWRDVCYIKFFCSKEWKKINHVGEDIPLNINLIGACQVNNYKGIVTNQVVIDTMETRVVDGGKAEWKARF